MITSVAFLGITLLGQSRHQAACAPIAVQRSQYVVTQQYGTGYAAPHYAAPHYAASYAQPYVAPAYNYNTVETKFVAVEPYVDYTRLAGDYVRSERRNEEQAKREKALYDQINNLAGSVNQLRQIVVQTGLQPPAQQQPQFQAPPPPYPAPQQQQTTHTTTQYYGASPQAPPFAAPPPPGKNIPAQLPPLPQKAPPLLRGEMFLGGDEQPAQGQSPGQLPQLLTSCTGCHTAPNAKGGMTLFAASGEPVPGLFQTNPQNPTEGDKVKDAIAEQRMPPNAATLPPVSLSQFKELTDFLSGSGQAQRGVALNR